MPDNAQPALVLAHQLNPAFAGILLRGLPGGVTVQALAPAAAWEVPAAAQILVAVPPRGGNVTVPAAMPQGWPGNLRWLHTVSAGVDEFPAWIYDVPLVTCGRGSNSVPIAEYTLAAMLAVEKKLPESWISAAAQWQPTAGLGTLDGKVLGLLGFGSIGQEIARRARAFGMEILAHRRAGNAPDRNFPDVRFTGLDDVLAQADHLVIALPLTPATATLIDAAALARLKTGAHLINIARGGILDHTALLAALESGQLGFATLDVTEPEPLPAGHGLYGHPRVHLSPHISWSGGERLQAAATLFQENLRRFRAGQALLNPVLAARGY